jgi:hypothetical protein
MHVFSHAPTRRATLAAAALTLGAAGCGEQTTSFDPVALETQLASGDLDDRCAGALGGESVDAVVVPEGSTCTLTATRVQGDIRVEPGATFTADGIWVEGNVQAQGQAAISLLGGSVVRGDVQIQQGGDTHVEGAVIGGNLQVQQNTGHVHLSANRVDGHVQANQIAKELQCEGNDPPPTGGGNVADDKKKQCEEV